MTSVTSRSGMAKLQKSTVCAYQGVCPLFSWNGSWHIGISGFGGKVVGNGWGLGGGRERCRCMDINFNFTSLPKVWIVLHDIRHPRQGRINDVLSWLECWRQRVEFLFKKSLLRLAFLLRVEGLFRLAALEAVTGAHFSWMLLAMEKLKVEPMEREKVKD